MPTLITLPKAIRDKVYGHLHLAVNHYYPDTLEFVYHLDHIDYPFICARLAYLDVQNDWGGPRLYPTPISLSAQLLRVSRQVYHEASAVLYGENTFAIAIDFPEKEKPIQYRWPRVLHPLQQSQAQLIKRYAITVWLEKQNDLGLACSDVKRTCRFLSNMPKQLHLNVHLGLPLDIEPLAVFAGFALLQDVRAVTFRETVITSRALRESADEASSVRSMKE